MTATSPQPSTSAAPAAPSAGAAPASRARPGTVLAVLSTALFLSSLDLFVVNVGLSHIGSALGNGSLSSVSWVLNAYAIFYAALLVPAGRLADRLGPKSAFLAGVALFTLSSLGCALSADLWVLVVFRCVQAIGAALLTPSSLGLLLVAVPAERRAAAVRVWASSGSLGAAAGPAVGGLLLEASWRWIFLINLPIGVAALVAGLPLLPHARHNTEARLPDLAGGALLIVTIGALAFGLVQAPEWGWGSGSVVTGFAVAALALVLLVLRSRRHPVPVIQPALLRDRAFAWANVAMLLFSVVFAADLLVIILWMQAGWHWSPLRTGLAIVPGPCMVWAFAVLGARLQRFVPAGVVAALGTLMLGVSGVILQHFSGSPSDYWIGTLPGWIIGGAGVGLGMPTIISAATSALPQDQSATGSAIVNMARQIGSVLGTSILVAILATATATGERSAFVHAWWTMAALSVVGACAALAMAPLRRSAKA
jgi:EmrB/QacA subfamily drug resistance transporter